MDNFFMCLESMNEADMDRDNYLSMQEYQIFAKYFGSQLGYDQGELSDDLKDLFDYLIEESDGDEDEGININGVDDTATMGEERVEALSTVCTVVEGCICCGICSSM